MAQSKAMKQRIMVLKEFELPKKFIQVTCCAFPNCPNDGVNVYTVSWSSGLQHEKDDKLVLCDYHTSAFTIVIDHG